jgi:CheY-like chemotaxis protein
LVAKILVADDNSNIQKMVGLALKDQGIDVVAVGNGEAAVRKISDVKPDLVLADVFMPVRNGYEVCQYVKGDNDLAHIPVILLVGAFDPLDEQEAQRVGADGVLKKPFVPPDPLISMVKSALARAGVIIGPPPPPPPPKEEPIRAAAPVAPRPVPTFSAPPPEEFPSAESEPAHEAIGGRPEPVRIDSGSQPLAFGSLLETPTEEEDLGMATTARPQLEHDWGADDDEEDEVDEEEDEKGSSSWRHDAGDEAVVSEAEAEAAVKDWRETAFSDAPARKSGRESWAPQKETSKFEEAAAVEASVSAVVTEAPVAEKKLEPAAAAPFTPAAAPFTEDAWSAALQQKTLVEAATLEVPPPPKTQAPAEIRAEVPVTAPMAIAPETVAPTIGLPELPPAPAAEKPAPAQETPWFSAVSSPWDAEVQKASKLASTWDAPVVNAPVAAVTIPEPPAATLPAPSEQIFVTEVPQVTVDALPPAPMIEAGNEKVEEGASPAATVEALHEGTHYVSENVLETEPSAASPKAAAPKMEDLVAKVLAQMSPDMLQAVTREILKPVVEAMVKDELNAKKQ